MEELQVFNFNNNEVRTIQINDEPFWVLSDVCKVLEMQNPTMVIKRLDNDEYTKSDLGLKNGAEQTLVNESGLFKVIVRSDKPLAKPFTNWVTKEVLPTIRKTGGYVNNVDMFIDNYLPFADDNTKQMFKLTLTTINTQNKLISEMKPKVEYFDDLVDRNLLTNIRDTAKELHIPENKFIDFLLGKYCYRDQKKKIKPRAEYISTEERDGLFELKEWSKNGKSGNQTLITPRGRETFRLLLKVERKG